MNNNVPYWAVRFHQGPIVIVKAPDRERARKRIKDVGHEYASHKTLKIMGPFTHCVQIDFQKYDLE